MSRRAKHDRSHVYTGPDTAYGLRTGTPLTPFKKGGAAGARWCRDQRGGRWLVNGKHLRPVHTS